MKDAGEIVSLNHQFTIVLPINIIGDKLRTLFFVVVVVVVVVLLVCRIESLSYKFLNFLDKIESFWTRAFECAG